MIVFIIWKLFNIKYIKHMLYYQKTDYTQFTHLRMSTKGISYKVHLVEKQDDFHFLVCNFLFFILLRINVKLIPPFYLELLEKSKWENPDFWQKMWATNWNNISKIKQIWSVRFLFTYNSYVQEIVHVLRDVKKEILTECTRL